MMDDPSSSSASSDPPSPPPVDCGAPSSPASSDPLPSPPSSLPCPSPVSSPPKRSPQSSPPSHQVTKRRKKCGSLNELERSDVTDIEDTSHHPDSPVVSDHEIDAGTAAIDDCISLAEDVHDDDLMNSHEQHECAVHGSEGHTSSVSSDCDSSHSSAASDSESLQDDSDDCCTNNPFHIGNVPVSETSTLSVNEAIIHVMDLFFEENMKKSSLQKVIDLVQRFLPESNHMPKTVYRLLQYVENLYPLVPETVHYYCKDCLLYVGKSSENCSLYNCKQNNTFYQLSLAHQIKILFEYHELANHIDDYSKRRNVNQNHGYSDILDGSEYRRASLPGRYDLTLVGHLVGVSVSKSSNMSMWALEFATCEVPFHLRFKLLLVAGIWMDNSKPIITSYMKPFFEEFNNLLEEGFSWKHPRTNAPESSEISVVGFCADAPVRAQLKKNLSHGGKYSCHTCEQKTVKLPAEAVLPGQKQGPKRRVFTFREEESPYRTAARMEQQAQSAIEHRKATGKLLPCEGVRGKSVASLLPMCDRSTFVYPEYVHLLIGFVKKFLVLWFEVDGEWCLKSDRHRIDQFLESLRVPDYVTRIPRITQSYAKWKANEYRSFLLYFSPVILSEIMNEIFFQHWMLLVSGIFLLFQDIVSESDIARAEVFFRMFLRDFSTLYRAQDFTYNLHQLLHLGVTVKRWGPLGCNSAFPLENFNGFVANLMHGKRNQGKELSNTLRLIQSVNCLKARTKEGSQVTTVQFYSVVRNFKFSSEQEALIKNNLNVDCSLTVHSRVKVGNVTYTTFNYNRQVKRNNFTVCFYNNSGGKSFGEIVCLFRNDNNTIQMAFIRCFVVDHLRTLVHSETRFALNHVIPIAESTDLALIPISKIQFKVIRVGSYVCLRPNQYEINL